MPSTQPAHTHIYTQTYSWAIQTKFQLRITKRPISIRFYDEFDCLHWLNKCFNSTVNIAITTLQLIQHQIIQMKLQLTWEDGRFDCNFLHECYSLSTTNKLSQNYCGKITQIRYSPNWFAFILTPNESIKATTCTVARDFPHQVSKLSDIGIIGNSIVFAESCHKADHECNAEKQC